MTTDPTPPEGYRLLTDDEKKLPLPMDAITTTVSGIPWEDSIFRGQIAPEDQIKWPYATRTPETTPETDVQARRLAGYGDAVFVYAYFARDLERRLTAAEAARESAERERDALAAKCGGMSAEQRFNQLMDVRNELVKAGHNFGLACTHHYASAVVTELIEARSELAALKAKVEEASALLLQSAEPFDKACAILLQSDLKTSSQKRPQSSRSGMRTGGDSTVSASAETQQCGERPTGHPQESESSLGHQDKLAALQSALDASAAREQGLREALDRVLKSAVPNKRDNPAMWEAWKAAGEALSSSPSPLVAELRAEVERLRALVNEKKE